MLKSGRMDEKAIKMVATSEQVLPGRQAFEGRISKKLLERVGREMVTIRCNSVG